MVHFLDWEQWKHPGEDFYLKLLCDENVFEMKYHGFGNIEGDLVFQISSIEENFDEIVHSLERAQSISMLIQDNLITSI